MTKDEMSRIIAEALPAHDWKRGTLPDYLANQIAIREQEDWHQMHDRERDLRLTAETDLKYWQERTHKAEAAIAVIRHAVKELP